MRLTGWDGLHKPVSIRFSTASRLGIRRLKIEAGLRRWRRYLGALRQGAGLGRALAAHDRPRLTKQPAAASEIVQTATMVAGLWRRLSPGPRRLARDHRRPGQADLRRRAGAAGSRRRGGGGARGGAARSAAGRAQAQDRGNQGAGVPASRLEQPQAGLIWTAFDYALCAVFTLTTLSSWAGGAASGDRGACRSRRARIHSRA